jgi:3D (Asp-Asp-Asp) domain-containing protein
LPILFAFHSGEFTQDNVIDETRYETYEVTAYTAGYESTGKRPGHPAYGITASGAYVTEWQTLACPKELPFGSRIYIPYFDTEFICEDRGGDITEGRLDVYIADLDEALAFGRRELSVLIINEEESE